MIPESYPAIDQLTSLGVGEAIFQTWNRHKAYLVLSATSRRLREIFYVRSCMTRVASKRKLPTMVRLLKQVEITRHTFFIECVFISFASGIGPRSLRDTDN
jgi:hypothetical protein